MFKSSSIEDELLDSMERELVASQLEEQHGFNKLAKAIDHLNAAADIFDQSGMSKEAEELTKILSSMTDKEWKDQLVGGLADDKTPKDFNKKDLLKGLKVELEHTKDLSIATEIAMDHLTEDPKYYDKLEKMENK